MKYILILKLINGLGHSDFLKWKFKTLKECNQDRQMLESMLDVKLKCRKL